MTIAIKIENLGKRYRLGETHERTLSDQIARLARRLSGRRPATSAAPEDFWALRDVNLEIAEGEAVGIIGGNGAGKSTLLKILSRITQPTTGRALVRGRLSSLLEVGTGFHAELTGRENVFLNGTILGMRKHEVARKFDEIVAFAGVEQFIDTPVKRYSSGMYVRLAFAVAAHLEPDVLVIDEVLAVGDAEFQKRCLGKMGDLRSDGRTLLFVSHNLGAISRICSSCILLEQGQVCGSGPTPDVIGIYQGLKSDLDPAGECFRPLETPATIHGNVLCVSVAAVDQDANSLKALCSGDPLRIRITIEFSTPIEHGLDIGLETADGQQLASFASHLMGGGTFSPVHRATHELTIASLPLSADEYFVSVRVTRPGIALLYVNPRIARIIVSPRDIYSSGFPPAAANSRLALRASWQ